MQNNWGFYGRNSELANIERIISSDRWFFYSISGRHRIGKTTLIQKAIQNSGKQCFYFQVPDSDERGVIQAFWEALEDTPDVVGFPTDELPDVIKSFRSIVATIMALNKNGVIVIIDEFQYFHRRVLSPFTSHLQSAVDILRDSDSGGLFVLGSIHTEMTAILEDRASPLFNRVTHRISLEHWDFSTLFEMFDIHDVRNPKHWLFLWGLFEGVPKFYRDCFDQGVLNLKDDYRQSTLQSLFFEGSSPLRDEAVNWFLRELHGRYDSVLKILANKGPCAYSDLKVEYDRTGSDKQLGGYLSILIDRYQMIEKLQPIFATKNTRKARYSITDNFLSAWLRAISRNVQMAKVQPIERPLERTDVSLKTHEGYVFEKMVRQLLQESSRKGVGDFMLTDFVNGYWNKADGSDVEIDIVALNDEDQIVRFGSCKRSASAHNSTALTKFKQHVERFLKSKTGQRLAGWRIEHALFSPVFTIDQIQNLEAEGFLCRDLPWFQNRLYPSATR